MSITTRTITDAKCDHCHKEIENPDTETFVDAMVYGVAFHLACWLNIGGPRVARVLYLDDIKYRNGPEDGKNAWGPR